MAEAPSTRVWFNRLVFVGLAFVLIVVQLVPLDMRPMIWAAPDILLAATLAWVARRPDYLPVIVIAAVFLLTDLLFQRPPGLWAALVVVLTEAIRKRARGIRNMPLLLEWGTIAFGIVAITLANRLVLAVVMTPQPPLGLTLIQMIATILSYPLVVFVAYAIFRVSRPAPGQVDGRGHKL
ncbi:rod shape-determining protein MreD [Yoonia sediminilitoris]|uniref:Rod shape-determining protein MreD n=1 Tax=Yoonia sediminilitoris TaxID=1286148 RepID=A0A2T6KKC4_9RHOB|nr:rod shape-determining protein MreD [Yoonia sediminilitoris]PUB16420.1 rod shape-determining protein MreD [Yoonia sediminilitoris]RCW96769.1 rod shape-determining protein MreD [Yoonia sediminilitoris]